MNPLLEDMENALTGSQSSHASFHDIHSINPTQLMARIESYEGREKKGISDVRRTFCLFVTFDLLFITLLWIIELNVSFFSPRLYKNSFQRRKINYIVISDSFSKFLFLPPQKRQHWSFFLPPKGGNIGLFQLIRTFLVLQCQFLKQTQLI